MSKVQVLVTVDHTVHEQAKQKGFNVSQICEQALYSACKSKKVSAIPMVSLTKAERKLAVIYLDSKRAEQRAFLEEKIVKSIYVRTGLTVPVSEVRKKIEGGGV